MAITDRHNTVLLGRLSELTGYAIFPVWVDPIRMRLIIRRAERQERSRVEMLRGPSMRLLERCYIHTMVMFITYQKK